MIREYPSLINGKTVSLGGFFDCISEFYPDHSVRVGNASPFVIEKAKYTAIKSRELKDTTRDQRRGILEKAADILSFDEDETEHVVMATGMSIKKVRKYLGQVPRMLRETSSLIGTVLASMETTYITDGRSTKVERKPIEGYAYVVTPGNDPRASAFIVPVLAMLGIPFILKASSSDAPIATKVIEALHGVGYPASASNLVFYDTNGQHARRNNFSLVDGSSIIWPFGDDATVDRFLRIEEVGNGIIKDHFSGKSVIRQASGRSGEIVDTPYRSGYAEKIGRDAFEWYIGCNSAKWGMHVGESHRVLMEKLAEYASKLTVGDPLDDKTDIGYTSRGTVKHLRKRLEELGRSGLLNVLYGGVASSEQQIIPIVAETNDKGSEGLKYETPAPIYVGIRTGSLKESFQLLRNLGGYRLAVALHTSNNTPSFDGLNVHHLRINGSTTDLDPLYHEGHDLLGEITTTRTISI